MLTSLISLLIEGEAAAAPAAPAAGAAAEGAANGAPQSGMSGLIMIVVLIAVFYFFMIRPQQKKAKEIRKFREALKEGDNVITAGGIHGKICAVKETTFLVSVGEGVKIKIDKGSVYPSAADVQQAQAK